MKKLFAARFAQLFTLCFACLLLAAPGSCQNGPTKNFTVHYAVTASDANGESQYSNDVAVIIPADGTIHTVSLTFVQSTSASLIKNCWYRGAAAGSYSLPGTCSSSPVTSFTDATLAAVTPPKAPSGLGSSVAIMQPAPSFDSAKPVQARVFRSKDGKLIATVH